MKPHLRKVALTAHVTFSVGWLGAVVPYIALAIVGLTSRDAQMVRAMYLSMELIGWFVIVPFSLVALLTGLVQSLGTSWGLFRHWWVVVKFLLTAGAILVLLGHMSAVSDVARLATQPTTDGANFRAYQIQLVVHAAGGLLVLLAITAISIFKPWGMTAYGRRKIPKAKALTSQRYDAMLVHAPVLATTISRWTRVAGIHAIIIVVLLVFLHLTGGGLRHS